MATILHMDTDAVREFSRWMTQAIEEMKSQVDQTAGSVQSMSWISPAQEQFLAEYEQARANLQRLIQEGETLNQRVTNEVSAWESVGQNGVSRFSEVIDPSFNFPSVGGWVPAVGSVIVGVSAGLHNLSKWWEKNQATTPIDKNKPMSEQDDYLLQQIANNLKKSSRGRKFLEEIKHNGLKFTLPDGSFLGDPNGKEVPVKIGETKPFDGKDIQAFSTPDINPNNDNPDEPIIMISEEWLRQNKSIDNRTASSTLAHEMQHQLDDKLGRTVYCDESKMSNMKEKELEAYISNSIQTRYETEIRAWELGHKIDPRQKGTVPVEGYESHFETEISKFQGVSEKYHIKVELGVNDTTRVNLIPLERLYGKPAYIG